MTVPELRRRLEKIGDGDTEGNECHIWIRVSAGTLKKVSDVRKIDRLIGTAAVGLVVIE